MTAVRTGPTPGAGDRRTGTRDGLSCTLFHTDAGTGALVAPTWRVLLPERIPVFHLPGVWALPPEPTVLDSARRAVAILRQVPGAA